MSTTKLTQGAQLDAILHDAPTQISTAIDYPVSPADLEWHSWPQMWSDSTLGRGGIGMQELAGAQTIIVCDTGSGAVAVYHGGKFDYVVKRPGEIFTRQAANHRLPAYKNPHFERDVYGT